MTSAYSPIFGSAGQSVRIDDASVDLFGMGLQLTYYLTPVNTYLSVTPSISTLSTSRGQRVHLDHGRDSASRSPRARSGGSAATGASASRAVLLRVEPRRRRRWRHLDDAGRGAGPERHLQLTEASGPEGRREASRLYPSPPCPSSSPSAPPRRRSAPGGGTRTAPSRPSAGACRGSTSPSSSSWAASSGASTSRPSAPGPVTATRPPSVESFLPISALVGLKRFLLTGYWDPVHPAGLTILAAAIVGALLARKAFCGWVCPVGTISRGLEWLGEKLFWRRRWPVVPRWLDLALMSLKYVLLALFAWAILWQMPLGRAGGIPALPLQRGRRREDAALLPRPLRHLGLGPGRPGPLVTRGEERLVPVGLSLRRAARARELRLAAAHRPRHRDLQRLRRLLAAPARWRSRSTPGSRSDPRSAPAASPAWRRARCRRAWG